MGHNGIFLTATLIYFTCMDTTLYDTLMLKKKSHFFVVALYLRKKNKISCYKISTTISFH